MSKRKCTRTRLLSLSLDIVEGEIDIHVIDDEPQGKVSLVVEQEELIVGESHLEPAQIDQEESSSRWSAVEHQALSSYQAESSSR